MNWTDVFVAITGLAVIAAILLSALIVWSAGAMSHPSTEHKRAVKGLKHQWEARK